MPGILGLLRFRPTTAKPLMELAEVLLRGESPLSRGERELIAAQVSQLNGCQFCYNAHGTHAALQIDRGWDTVDAIATDLDGRRSRTG
jgi:alkylhydroperoxidase family enzyme